MTRIPYDQTAKHLLDGALEGAGRAEAQHEVSSEPQWIDVWFERDHSKSPAPGLIGKMAVDSCAFEVFHGPLTLPRTLDCVAKQLGVYRRRRRRAGDGNVPPMWLLTTEQLRGIRTQMLAEPLVGWPAGFYRTRLPALPLYIVSIGALPRTRETLMLRLMGSDQVLRDALTELGDLPASGWEHAAATDALAVLHSFAAKTSRATSNEKAILMSASETYQRIKNEGRVALLAMMLERRFGELPAKVTKRMHAADSVELEGWAEALLDAKTLAEVFEGVASTATKAKPKTRSLKAK